MKSANNFQIFRMFRVLLLALPFAFYLLPTSISLAKSLELGSGETISDIRPLSGELSSEEHTLFDITVGKSTLSDVKKKFPDGLILTSGKEINEVSYLCFIDRIGNIAAFESSRPMGGPEHTVTSISLFGHTEKYIFKKDCKKSSDKFDEIEAGNGIKLGAKIDKIRKNKGPSSHSSKTYLIYSYENSRSENGKPAEILGTIKLKILKQHISEITITRIFTY